MKGSVAGLALAAAVAGAQAEEPKVAPLGNDQVAATTQAATQRLMVAVDTTLVAQAAPPESDGKPPITVMVKQVDGSMKPVSYFRDKQWAIIPPPVADGKLVDGSPAPSHPIRALNAQVKILVPYDKNAQTTMAMIGDRDIITEALTYSKSFREMVDSWRPITREQVELLLFHSYIMIESWRKFDGWIKTAQQIASWSLKMTSTQFEEMRSSSEQKAKKVWKDTTGAVA